jgi:hypothetical protein
MGIEQGDLTRLAHALVRYQRWLNNGDIDPPVPHPDELANETVTRLARARANDGWEIIRELVRIVPEDLLGDVAAGPFEDWIGDETAKQFEAELRDQIHRDYRFRRMARAAWELPAIVNNILAEVRLME